MSKTGTFFSTILGHWICHTGTGMTVHCSKVDTGVWRMHTQVRIALDWPKMALSRGWMDIFRFQGAQNQFLKSATVHTVLHRRGAYPSRVSELWDSLKEKKHFLGVLRDFRHLSGMFLLQKRVGGDFCGSHESFWNIDQVRQMRQFKLSHFHFYIFFLKRQVLGV